MGLLLPVQLHWCRIVRVTLDLGNGSGKIRTESHENEAQANDARACAKLKREPKLPRRDLRNRYVTRVDLCVV